MRAPKSAEPVDDERVVRIKSQKVKARERT